MNMKSLMKFVVFGAVAFMASFYYKRYLSEPKGLQLPDQVKLREYVQAPLSPREVSRVEAFLAQSTEKNTDTADQGVALCIEQRRRFLALSHDEILKEISLGRFVLSSPCAGADQQLVNSAFIDMIYKNCLQEKLNDTTAQENCASGLFFYKSILVSKSNQGRRLDELDSQSLIHELFADLGTGNMKTETSVDKMIQVTQRLIELMPNSPGAYKAALIPEVLKGVDSLKRGEDPPQSLLTALEKALQMNPNDPQLENIQNMILTRDGREISVEKAADLAASRADSVNTQLFYAKALARHKNYEEARAFLEATLQRFPNDVKLREAYQRLKERPNEFGQFEISLGSEEL